MTIDIPFYLLLQLSLDAMSSSEFGAPFEKAPFVIIGNLYSYLHGFADPELPL